MAKKKEFTPELQACMRRAGLDWRYFEIVNELPRSLLVRHKETNQVLLIRKEQGNTTPQSRPWA